jgi:hypothetical protein
MDYYSWAFHPGSLLIGVRYPHFPRGWVSSWDWDGDGIPNRWDLFPFSYDGWNSCMCDPWYFGWNSFPLYWAFWGGPEHFRPFFGRNHHERDLDVLRRIGKGQLHDRGDRDYVRNHIIEGERSRNLTGILSQEGMRQLQANRQEQSNKQFSLANANPTVRIRNKDGSESNVRITAPQSRPIYNGTGGVMRRDGTNTQGNNGGARVITPRTGTSTNSGSGRVITPNPPRQTPPPTMNRGGSNSGRSSGGTVIRRREGENSTGNMMYNAPTQRESYAPRSNTTTYAPTAPNSTSSSRIIRPTPQEVRKYSSPVMPSRNYSAPNSNVTTRQYQPSTRSAPVIRSSPTYSRPSIATLSRSSYSGSSRSTGSSSARSSGSVRRR